MGIAKRLMEELIQERVCQAEWECPLCEEPNMFYSDVPDINFTSDDASDYHASEELILECDSCDFKAEGSIENGVSGVTFHILGPDDKPIHVEAPGLRDYPDPADDYFYWEPSDSPYDVYVVTLEGLRLLINTPIPIEHDDQLINRLAFAQIFTALEAYLSDSLILLAKNDPEIQKALYENVKPLRQKRFSGEDILVDPDAAKTHLLGYLRKEISFHNLVTADKLYKIAINQSIFDDKPNRDLLVKAVSLRHDCVHRNGKTEEGEKLECFETSYVESIATAADTIVMRLYHIITALQFDCFELTENDEKF